MYVHRTMEDIRLGLFTWMKYRATVLFLDWIVCTLSALATLLLSLRFSSSFLLDFRALFYVYVCFMQYESEKVDRTVQTSRFTDQKTIKMLHKFLCDFLFPPTQ
ncbi:hypothetical protein L1887_16709 [Cichorium endivia]|nr:hypothetical protein L1887_16709 [Cichorium endivia]